MQDMRNISNPDLQRIHYTEKKDIRNIQRDFKLGYHTMKFHENDEISVDVLVHSLFKKEDTVILHNEKSDSLFHLIIMTRIMQSYLH